MALGRITSPVRVGMCSGVNGVAGVDWASAGAIGSRNAMTVAATALYSVIHEPPLHSTFRSQPSRDIEGISMRILEGLGDTLHALAARVRGETRPSGSGMPIVIREMVEGALRNSPAAARR